MDGVGDAPPQQERPVPRHPSKKVNTKRTREGQNVAGPFIKESTEGDGRLWRKKVSLEKRVKERMRKSRAKG